MDGHDTDRGGEVLQTRWWCWKVHARQGGNGVIQVVHDTQVDRLLCPHCRHHDMVVGHQDIVVSGGTHKGAGIGGW